VPAGDGRFRLVGAPPKDERLQFKRGEIVECEIRAVPGGSKDLVAIRSVTAEPEFRKRQYVFAGFGAIVGAFFGAVVALWFETSLPSAAIGATGGAVTFGFCSIRWGDAAWDALARGVRWMFFDF
jgi:hypothetical protein